MPEIRPGTKKGGRQMANYSTARSYERENGQNSFRLLRPGMPPGRNGEAVAPVLDVTAIGTVPAVGTNRVLSKFPVSLLRRLRPHFREVTVTKDDYLFQQ